MTLVSFAEACFKFNGVIDGTPFSAFTEGHVGVGRYKDAVQCCLALGTFEDLRFLMGSELFFRFSDAAKN